jgi:predicted nucleic acid-binding protein
MPDADRAIVTNTTPLIALAVATDDLDVLRVLYQRVIVPAAVAEEVLALGFDAPGARAFLDADWLLRRPPVTVSAFLRNSLDRGEAAVIQTALDEGIQRVCLDEAVGRRAARLNGLTLTGSVGVLVKARQQGYSLDMADALRRMREHGIWLGADVIRFALEQPAP